MRNHEGYEANGALHERALLMKSTPRIGWGGGALVHLAKCNCNDLFRAERSLYGKSNYCEWVSSSMISYEGARGEQVCLLAPGCDILEVHRATKRQRILAREGVGRSLRSRAKIGSCISGVHHG